MFFEIFIKPGSRQAFWCYNPNMPEKKKKSITRTFRETRYALGFDVARAVNRGQLAEASVALALIKGNGNSTEGIEEALRGYNQGRRISH